jgi:hypothetical protein
MTDSCTDPLKGNKSFFKAVYDEYIERKTFFVCVEKKKIFFSLIPKES